VLLALRDALAAADGGAVRLTELARRLDAEPDAVLAALAHGSARGWLPDVRVLPDLSGVSGRGARAVTVMGCGTSAAGCTPAPTNPHCRRCPLAG
jgi:hypothetical protein